MIELNFAKFIFEVLDPETNKLLRFRDIDKRLKIIIDKELASGTPLNNIYFTFTNVPRLNTYPHISKTKSTPYGIFGYPAKKLKDKSVSEMPAFTSRPYIILFKSDEIHEIGDNGTLQQDKEFLKTKQDIFKNTNLDGYRKLLRKKFTDLFADEFYNNHSISSFYYALTDGLFSLEQKLKDGDSNVKFPKSLDEFLQTYGTPSGRSKASFAINHLPEIEQYFGELMQSIEKESKDKDTKEVNYPFKSQLMTIAKRDNLDLTKALKSITHAASINTPKRFAYQVTQRLAQQATNSTKLPDPAKRIVDGFSKPPSTKKKEHHWPVMWTKYLKELGFDNFVDSLDSGYIHSAEPSQGVFLQPDKLKIIDIVYNDSHSDYIGNTGRPSKDNWSPDEKKHGFSSLSSGREQRRGPKPMKMYKNPIDTKADAIVMQLLNTVRENPIPQFKPINFMNYLLGTLSSMHSSINEAKPLVIDTLESVIKNIEVSITNTSAWGSRESKAYLPDMNKLLEKIKYLIEKFSKTAPIRSGGLSRKMMMNKIPSLPKSPSGWDHT